MQLTRYKLGQLLNVSRGASLAGEYYAEQGDLIRLTLGNFDLANGGFKPNTSKTDIYFTGPVREEFILKKGDIITPLTEQTLGLLGSTARIPESGKYIQSQDVALIKCQEEVLDPSFAYYLISSKQVRNQLSAAAQQTKIRHTTPDKIKDCVVDIPSIENQRKIGRLLDSISDKIALNRQTNCDLEAMAKQLYDYWFVQFDFPNEEGKPYKSSGGKMVWNEILKREIPEGWDVRQLGETFNSNRGISYSTNSISGGGIPMINLASFNTNGSYKPKGLKTYNGEYTDEKILKPFDLVMCNTQQTAIDYKKDIIGKSFLVPDLFDTPVVSSHHVTTIKPHNTNLKAYYCYLFNSTHFHRYAAMCSSGTNIMGLDFSGIERFKQEMPPNELLENFSEQIFRIKQEITLNEKNIMVLNNLRDNLLPLLMNGQVSIKQ